VTDLTELGHRQESIKQEIVRLSQHPAHIHRLTEDERAAQVLALQDELRLVQQEIEQAAQAAQQRLIGRVYGTEGQQVPEDAQKQLKRAQEDLAKTLAGFESQTRGYARKIHDAQVAVFAAMANAGQAERRPNMVLNGLGQKLATMVEHAIRFG
jgi:hypothetical protein